MTEPKRNDHDAAITTPEQLRSFAPRPPALPSVRDEALLTTPCCGRSVIVVWMHGEPKPDPLTEERLGVRCHGCEKTYTVQKTYRGDVDLCERCERFGLRTVATAGSGPMLLCKACCEIVDRANGIRQ